MKLFRYHIKVGMLIFMMSMLVHFYKAQCNPNFGDTSSICGVVQFTNLSTVTNSTTGYFWDLGNSSTSTLTSPMATYTSNGTYTVCLMMYNTIPSCSNTICKTVTVNCFTTSCTANFGFSLCTGGGQMNFVNTSPGTNSTTVYNWDFGNSTGSSLANPTATYVANGIYTVCLNYTTTAPAYCTASICKTVNISCATPTCTANFSTLTCVPSGTNAQISFTNLSTSSNTLINYNWNFGNNTFSSQQNPVATFTANGTYTVCLSISSNTPFCIDSVCQVINVSCVPPPASTCAANFTNTPCTNGQVTFYSISSGTNSSTTYTWTNSAPPNQTNPQAPYTVTVCLKMQNTSPACTHSVCKTVLVDCSAIGFEEYNLEDRYIKVFPNPGNGLFTMDMSKFNSEPYITLRTYNILGELVNESKEEVLQTTTTKQLDLQYLPNGTYFLHLRSGNNVYFAKLIISK